MDIEKNEEKMFEGGLIKIALGALVTIASLYIGGYFFTKGALAAGGKGATI